MTVDNGISAVEEAAFAACTGHRPDHHRPPSAAGNSAQGRGQWWTPP
ncbi:MAG: hypothetical protein ACLVJH_15190 [Faecalibacterium prausnitzii]